MGKKKRTIQKAPRPYATTSIPSKATINPQLDTCASSSLSDSHPSISAELKAPSLSQPLQQLNQESSQHSQSSPYHEDPASWSTTKDEINSSGLHLEPWKTSRGSVSIQYEAVFSNRVAYKPPRDDLKASVFKEFITPLLFKPNQQAKLLPLLESLGYPLQNQSSQLIVSSWAPILSDPKLKPQVLACMLDLERDGLSLDQACLAMKYRGPYRIPALEWLVCNVKETQLPDSWTKDSFNQVKPSQQDFKMIIPSVSTLSLQDNNQSSLEQILSLQPSWNADENNKHNPGSMVDNEVFKSPIPSIQTSPEIHKKIMSDIEDPEHRKKILQLVMMQQQEEEEEQQQEQEQKQSASLEDKSDGLSVEERFRVLVGELQMEKMRAKAAIGDEKRQLGSQIKALNEKFQQLMKEHPELSKLNQESDNKEPQGDQTKNKAPFESDQVILPPSQEMEQLNFQAPESIDIFGKNQSLNENKPTISGSKEAFPKLIELDIGDRISPVLLLKQHVKKTFPKNKANIVFNKIGAIDYQYSIWIDDQEIERMNENEFCKREGICKIYLSLKALYKLAKDFSYHKQMSKNCIEMWESFKKRDDEKREKAVYKYRMERITKTEGLIDKVSATCRTHVNTIQPLQINDNSETKSPTHTSSPREARNKIFSRSWSDKLKLALEKRRNSSKYKNYEKERQSLPVLLVARELESTLVEGNVVVLSGQTGSGKTTQVPRILFEYETLSGRGDGCNIVCTEPRRISTISVARRVSEEVGDNALGDDESYVGYQIRGEKVKGPSCKITYCTTGVLLRQIQNDQSLSSISHVVVDEVHERTVESDLLLILLRRIIQNRSYSDKNLKVVLMSATIDLEKLSCYFGYCPVLQAGGRTYPVTRFNLEKCVELTGYVCEIESPYCKRRIREEERSVLKTADLGKRHGTVQYNDDQESFEREICETGLDENKYSRSTIQALYRMDQTIVNFELIEDLITMIVSWRHGSSNETGGRASHVFLELEEALHTLGENSDGEINGSILVFLPGMFHIDLLHSRLKHNKMFSDESCFWIFRLHSSLVLNKKEQKTLFQSAPKDVVKIILSTNVAETGITIPDVVYVIDSGRVKETGFHAGRQMESLEESFVSQANLTQRAGRAGRLKAGLCFHLLSSQLQDKLEEHPVPEIQRVGLHSLCMQSLTMNKVETPWRFLNEALDPPSKAAIDAAMQSLEYAGAVQVIYSVDDHNKENPLKASLTALGEHLSQFPVDVKVGKMLIYAALLECLDPILTVGAGIEKADMLFVSPSNLENEAATMHKQFRDERSDLLSIYNAYFAWIVASDGDVGKEERFCGKNFLNLKVLKEIRQTKKELLEALTKSGFVDQVVKVDEMMIECQKNGMKIGKYLTNDKKNRRSNNLSLVCGVICAGLYPQIAVRRTERSEMNRGPGNQWYWSYLCKARHSYQEERVELVKKSVNYGMCGGAGGARAGALGGINREEMKYCGDQIIWLAYLTKLKTKKKIVLWDSTVIPQLALILFGGQLTVSFEERTLSVDGWIQFRMNPKIGVILKQLRAVFDGHLENKFRCPQSQDDGLHEKLVTMIADSMLC